MVAHVQMKLVASIVVALMATLEKLVGIFPLVFGTVLKLACKVIIQLLMLLYSMHVAMQLRALDDHYCTVLEIWQAVHNFDIFIFLNSTVAKRLVCLLQ